MEGLWNQVDIGFPSDWLDPRYDWNGDSCLAAFSYKREIVFIDEEHLGDYVMGPSFDLQLEHGDIMVEIRGFGMFFRVPSHTDTKRCRYRIFQARIQVFSSIDSRNLPYHTIRMVIAVFLGYETTLAMWRISSYREDVVNT